MCLKRQTDAAPPKPNVSNDGGYKHFAPLERNRGRYTKAASPNSRRPRLSHNAKSYLVFIITEQTTLL